MQQEIRRKIRLVQGQCPGDVLVMTMAIESLHRTYPGEYVTGVRTNHNDIFNNNPHVVDFGADEEGVTDIVMHYDRIHECHIPFHFGEAYCDTLGKALGVPLTLKVNRPYLYLSTEEAASHVLRDKTGFAGRYAVINAGCKADYPTKWAGTDLYQSVVDAHRGQIRFVQIGATGNGHHHPKLEGVIDLVGKTTVRELILLCLRASFGVGGITFLEHVFAAYSLPYVCLIGGREPVSWITYPTQVSLNTHGLLPCCRTNACWKSKMDEDKDQGAACLLPVIDAAGCKVPTCMAMLKQAAVDAVGVLIETTFDVKQITAGRTLVDPERLTVIRDAVLKTAELPGDMAEFGCYRGGTSKLIAMSNPNKKLHVFDGFEMGIPEDDEANNGHHKGEFACPVDEVRAFLNGLNVELHPGKFPDTATATGLDDVRLSFVHLDFDTYQSTRAALSWVWPRLVEGGVVVLDDWDWHRCEGVRQAVEEILPDVPVTVTTGMQAMLKKEKTVSNRHSFEPAFLRVARQAGWRT